MKQPKEKATELTEYFDNPKNNCQTDNAIQCALKVVNEIIKENHEIDKEADIPQELVRLLIKRLNFWQAVKKELIK